MKIKSLSDHIRYTHLQIGFIYSRNYNIKLLKYNALTLEEQFKIYDLCSLFYYFDNLKDEKTVR